MIAKISSFNFIDYTPSISSLNDHGNAETVKRRVNNPDLGFRVCLEENNSSADKSSFVIDEVIRASVASQAFREDKINYWTSRRTTYERSAQLCGAVVFIGGIGTYASKQYTALFVAAALAGLAMALFLRLWAEGAAAQQKGWGFAPEKTIAADRKDAYEKGFAFVYAQDMKIAPHAKLPRLAQFEVAHLFEKYLGERCRDLLSEKPSTDDDKWKWLKEFTTINPISPLILAYVYDDVPHKFSDISLHYQTLEKRCTPVKGFSPDSLYQEALKLAMNGAAMNG